MEADPRRPGDPFALDGDTALDIIERGNELIGVFGDDGIYVYASPSLAAAFGVRPDELVGTHFTDRLHPADHAAAQTAVAEHGEVTDVRLRHADGRWILAEGAVTPLPNRPGRPSLNVAFSRVISERRLAERLHHAVVEAAQEGIVVSDAGGRVLFANEAARAMLAYTAEELTGIAVLELLPTDEPPPAERAERRLRLEPERYECRLRRKDGTTFPVSVSATPLQLEDGTYGGSVSLVTDITDRLALQGQLLQSQKMEAIGQLAGGIAHDFNNVLALVSLHLDLIQRRGMTDGDASGLRQAVENGHALTRQLLAFAKRQPQAAVLLSPNEVARALAKLARPLLGSRIRLVLRLDEEAGAVQADRSQLEQVLMNLLLNARDAVAGGGRITIETGNRELDASYAPYEPNLRAGTYVMLGVSDDGVGMDEATRARIFEPFFTTKGDQGTGLGLPTSYGIVQAAGGFFWVYSQPGAGTTFKVYLPRADGAATERATAPASGQRILVVDDQPEIGLLAAELLNENGYRAVFVPGRAGALEELDREPFDAVLCDVFVGDDHGTDIVRALRRLAPTLPVLFMSGHTGEVLRRTQEQPLDERTDFIGKPFGLDDLLARFAALLAVPR